MSMEKDRAEYDGMREAEVAIGAIEGVELVPQAPEQPTMVSLVADLQKSLARYKVAREELSDLRGHLLDIKGGLAELGMNVELPGIYDDGGGSDGSVPMEQVAPIVPPAGRTFGPETDGSQTPEEMAVAVEQTGVERDPRNAAQITEQAHERVEEDQATFAQVLNSGYGGAVERGFADAGKKVAAANSGTALPFGLG